MPSVLELLSHSELSLIMQGIADPLQPHIVAVLGLTCRGLWVPTRTLLAELKNHHMEAGTLMSDCCVLDMTHKKLREAVHLAFGEIAFTAYHCRILRNLVWYNALPDLQELNLASKCLTKEKFSLLVSGLGSQTLASLVSLILFRNKLGDLGATTLAGAISNGALRSLTSLDLGANKIGDEGLAALAAPLRLLPQLVELMLPFNRIGECGIASLVAPHLGPITSLFELRLEDNTITDSGCSTLVSALSTEVLPKLALLGLHNNPTSKAARRAVKEAILTKEVFRETAQNARERKRLRDLGLTLPTAVDAPAIHEDLEMFWPEHDAYYRVKVLSKESRGKVKVKFYADEYVKEVNLDECVWVHIGTIVNAKQYFAQ